MYGSLYFQIASLAYIILLACIFFFKEKRESFENKIYTKLIIINIFGVIIDILSTYIGLFYTESRALPIIAKLYLVYLLAWLAEFTIYSLFITYRNEENKENYYKKIKWILTIIFVIASIVVISLPIYTYREGLVYYTYGLSAYFTYGIAVIAVLTWITVLLKSKERKNQKKFYPMIAIIVFGSISATLQFLYPELLLVTFAFVFVTVLMYFSIENPDLKMIELLNLAKDQAEKANSAKTEFLSSMSHEIRTPLNAIVGFSQSLMEEDIPDSSKEEIEDIINASQNLLQIVNGILDISKIEANKLEIINTEYNFQKIFDELVSLTKGKIGDKPLEFRHSCDSSIPPILYGDYARIKQIILNLLTNAVKYTEEGGIIFTVNSVVAGKVCRLIISVEDTGIGIKEENIGHLFSKFERFDVEKNYTIEGTGLGLAITKKLVELMQGKIVVQSKYGEGSKFTVAIDQRIVPKTLEEYTAENGTNTGKPFVGSNNKILVVDDNSINLKVANRLLMNYKLNVEMVTSGQECLDKILDGNNYELILLDDMMPKMSGTETLKNLKKIIGFETPVVALTANAIAGMREKYLASGFNDYLSKPIDKLKLEAILKKYLKEDTTVENNDTIEVKESELPMENRNVEFLKSNGVDVGHGLELLGDMETYDMTIEEFVKESTERIKKIEEYKNAGDMPNYAILVHAMKSDSKYLGFMTLADLAYQHEMASKNNDQNFVNANYDSLMAEANRILSVAREYIK